MVNRQISHASRAIPIPIARCIVRISRRERGIAIVIKVAATPRGPHAAPPTTKGREELRTKKLTETPHNPKAL